MAIPRRFRPLAVGIVFVASLALLAGGPSATPPVVQTRLALDHLGQVAIAWQNQFHCSGCHKQPITLAAFATAVSRGHDAPLPGVVNTLVTGTLTGTSGQDSNGCFSFAGSSGFTMATTFAGRGLEALDRHLGLRMAGCPRTAWSFRSPRAISSRPDTVSTSGSERTRPPGPPRIRMPLRPRPSGSATRFRRSRPPRRASRRRTVRQRMHGVLAGTQLGDGSWKIQSSTAGGNAYATGQALWALRAAGFDRGDPVLDAGRSWLLGNQQADGSWAANNWVGGNPSQVAPSMWGALALGTFPSPLATLRAHGETVEWSEVEGAESYDLIRGAVSALGVSGASVDLGGVDCLAPATSDVSAEDPDPPAPGEAFFYVFRIRWAGNHDGYGRSSDGRERVALTGDCSP
jgi:hypothetical protein